jgi:hypothetical protein
MSDLMPTKNLSSRPATERAKRGEWGAFCLFALATFPATLHANAQFAPCGISRVMNWSSPAYPPIARAAHIQGPVTFLVKFDTSGKATDVKFVAGPEMLRKVSLDSVQTMRVNSFEGTRECPVTITYQLDHCDEPAAKSQLPTLRVCTVPVTINTQTAIASDRRAKTSF